MRMKSGACPRPTDHPLSPTDFGEPSLSLSLRRPIQPYNSLIIKWRTGRDSNPPYLVHKSLIF